MYIILGIFVEYYYKRANQLLEDLYALDKPIIFNK